jgi:hypothetical protein
MIGLKIAGVLDRCRTFPDELDLELVRKMKIELRTRHFAVESLAELKQRGTAPDLESALQEAISSSSVSVLRIRAKRKLALLDHKYFGGRFQKVSMASRIKSKRADDQR